MERFKPKKKHGPEYEIQKRIIELLQNKGWLVLKTHGNMFQSGFPDLYATHVVYKSRWIEVKVSYETCHFTPAQTKMFPMMSAHGTGIWILTDATELEYKKLFSSDNWMYYFMKFKGAGY